MKIMDTEPESLVSDSTLLQYVQAGDHSAATELYVRYAQRLTRLAKNEMSDVLRARFDPEDVVQSVFRTFFRRAGESRFLAPSGGQIWQLLLVIAMNKVRRLARYNRQQKRDVKRTVVMPEQLPASTDDDHTALSVLQMVVDESLSSLPDYQRRMIQLRIQGYSTEEIAELTQRCTRTVERVLQRFRNEMRSFIEADETDQ